MVILHDSSRRGWQKGMREEVCFTAIVPAMMAVEKTGPFFVSISTEGEEEEEEAEAEAEAETEEEEGEEEEDAEERRAKISSGSHTIVSAVALRVVALFSLTSTIVG